VRRDEAVVGQREGVDGIAEVFDGSRMVADLGGIENLSTLELGYVNRLAKLSVM
jgi:hypothetical protein